MRDPTRHDVGRLAFLDGLTVECYASFLWIHDPGYGSQYGCFACTVGAEDRHDMVFLDVQANATNGRDRTVIGFDVADPEQW